MPPQGRILTVAPSRALRCAAPPTPSRAARAAPRCSSGGQTAPPRNPLGVHALVWVGGWTQAECQRAVLATKQAGYDLIEIPLLDPDSVDAAMTKRELAHHRLKATTSLGLRLDADISSADAEVAAAGQELLLKALRTSADLGASHMCGVIYSALAKYPGPPTAQGRRNCVAALRQVAAAASDLGLTLGVEAVNRYETNLLNTAAQAAELVDEVGAPNLSVHLDTYHMHIEEASMGAAVKACGPHLGYVHVGESHRGYLGSGSVDFPGFFRALVEAGYAGPVTFESFSRAVVSPHLSDTLAVWRDMWTDSMDLATQARAFMKAQLAAAAQHRHVRL